jgi:transposase
VKRIEKQLESAKISLRKLSAQNFACIADAEIAITKLSNSWKYYQIIEIKSQEKPVKTTKKAQRIE